MAQKIIKGNEGLAKQIKLRRNEIGLTIEEAALRAGVGTKTWSRYEAGESIRKDKCKGVCKALNWHGFPDMDEEKNELFSIQEYRNQEAWSPYLENTFGVAAALSFAVGCDILYDHIQEDMEALAAMPIGTHIGQLDISWLCDSLPEQFLMNYNYEFLYQLKCTLQNMKMRAKSGYPMTAYSVMEELLIYLCNEEGSVLIELSGAGSTYEDDSSTENEDWIFDLFGDEDIITCLYSDEYLEPDHIYHFSNWMKRQFYMD